VCNPSCIHTAFSKAFSKAASMKFHEFSVGQVIEAGPHPVGEDDILRFAREYDPQWFHVDKAAAQAGRFKGLIASGWQTCGIAMRLGVDKVLAGSESFASPGVAHIKWPNPVRPGDRLSLRATVLEVRRSRKDAGMGILRWRWQLFNQRGQEVLDLEATSLFDLAGSA
jgi:acyl dehydratase